ncbi:MAG: hypothetical protein ABIO38_08165 [Luteimonas sp.]
MLAVDLGALEQLNDDVGDSIGNALIPMAAGSSPQHRFVTRLRGDALCVVA